MLGELAATFCHGGCGTGLLHVVAPTAPAQRRLLQIVIVECGGELADVFAGVVEVEDFNRSGKSQAVVFFPNPCRPVPYEDDLLSPIKTAPAGFLMEQYGDLAPALVGAHVAGGIGKQGAVVIEGGDDLSAIGQERVAQPLLDPCGTLARSGGNQMFVYFGDEGFGFREPFLACFRAEFFFLRQLRMLKFGRNAGRGCVRY